MGTVALLVWRVRNPTWVRDAQLSQNGSPLISLLMLALGTLLVALVSAIGIFWVAARHDIVGWGMICVAASGLTHVWVNVWIRRQPFPQIPPGFESAEGDRLPNALRWQSNRYSPTMAKREPTAAGSARLWYSLALVGLVVAIVSGLLVGFTGLPALVGSFFVVLGLLVLIGAAGIGATKSRQR